MQRAKEGGGQAGIQCRQVSSCSTNARLLKHACLLRFSFAGARGYLLRVPWTKSQLSSRS
jgi:hypothetical protein